MQRRALAGLLAFGLCGAVFTQEPHSRRLLLSFDEAWPALQLLADFLPADLKSRDRTTLEALWPEWLKKDDAATRARLTQGVEDSLVNLLLFGTSFTVQPRVTADRLDQLTRTADNSAAAASTLDRITNSRLDDFIATAARPGGNERFAFVHDALEAKGYQMATVTGRSAARTYLLTTLARVLKDIVAYDRIIRQSALSGDASAQFSERSKIYQTRGLSSDTSLRPSFAIEEALKAMQAKLALTAKVRRVAVVGPGLDFSDKQEGYDFYPQQTMQPLALIDSLLRLKLATPDDVWVTTFDLNSKVNAHLRALRARSQEGRPYILQLPLDPGHRLTPDFLHYWSRFGDQIGAPARPAVVPSNAAGVKLRAVSVGPAYGARLTPIDVNFVLERVELPPEEKFDLIVGTNVFVYYDEFRQALAMLNLEKMLRPGGILLSNNAIVELPTSGIKSFGTTTVRYTHRHDDGDVIIWYKLAER